MLFAPKDSTPSSDFDPAILSVRTKAEPTGSSCCGSRSIRWTGVCALWLQFLETCFFWILHGWRYSCITCFRVQVRMQSLALAQIRCPQKHVPGCFVFSCSVYAAHAPCMKEVWMRFRRDQGQEAHSNLKEANWTTGKYIRPTGHRTLTMYQLCCMCCIVLTVCSLVSGWQLCFSRGDACPMFRLRKQAEQAHEPLMQTGHLFLREASKMSKFATGPL